MEIISHRKHAINLSPSERWISAAAGSALATYGLAQRSKGGLGVALAGAELVRRGLTGHSLFYEYIGARTADKGQGAKTTSVPYELGVRVERAITVGKPRAEVYRFWRDLRNLARFMKHVESVEVIDDRRSHWVVRAPAGRTVEWDAEINHEIENELLAFRSLEGAKVDVAGSVRFADAPLGLGTEVSVELQYNPPAGILGAFAAKMWGEEPTQQIREDLYRFKRIMEVGELPLTEGQPAGCAAKRAVRRQDVVASASEGSFPASDAPAWRL
jgi:uncharacterized membrane protein